MFVKENGYALGDTALVGFEPVDYVFKFIGI